MRKLRKYSIPIMIGIFLLVLAACGGDDDADGGGSDTPTQAPTSSASTDETFEFQYVCVNRTLLPCKVIQEFLDTVNTRTNGQVEIQLSSYPELGISGFDMIRLLEDGTIGMGEIYSGFVGGEYPVFEAANLWGAYENVDQWFEASEALQDDIIRLVRRETNGGEIVGFNYYSGNYFFTKNPLNTLEDFKGVTTRSHSNVLSDLIGTLGADPQTMAFADVYPALERGVLDGAVTCGSCAVGQKWFEVTDYLTGPVPGTFAETFITFNATQWNSLPTEFQNIIREEGVLHSERAKQAALNADVEAEGELIALGMTHSNFSEEMLVILKDAAASSVIPKWAERAGGPESEAVKLYNEKVAPITGLKVEADGTVSVSSPTAMMETELTSSGLSFSFQYACINRTLDPCELLAAPGGMVEKIFERTEGQVDIQISSFPELGLAGPDTLRLVEDGTLGMAEIYSGYVGGDLPIVDVANLWGVIPDIATNWKTIEAVQAPLHKLLEERSNGVVLAESYYGNNYYYTSTPIRSTVDLEGMKIRSHSTVLGDLISGMGADPQFVAFSEVYTALERGILDAAVTCGPCGAGLRWFEVSDYLNGPIISIGVTFITMNKDRWDEMPADLQAIVREEALAHQVENRRLMENVWDPAGIKDNVDGGMEFIEFTPELKTALKQASIDVVIPNWVERNGGPNSDAVKMFNDFVSPIIGVTIDSNGKAVEN